MAGTPETKIILPTGFETQQRRLAHLEAIQNALAERAVQGTPANATSWAQALAPLLQALVAKRMDSRIDTGTTDLNKQILDRYQAGTSSAAADYQKVISHQMPVGDWMQLHGGDWAAQDFKTALLAGATKQAENANTAEPTSLTQPTGPNGAPQRVTALVDKTGGIAPFAPGFSLPGKAENVNGVAVDLGTVPPGSVLPNQVSHNQIRMPDGSLAPNMVGIQAGRAINGGPLPANLSQPDPAASAYMVAQGNPAALPPAPPTGNPGLDGLANLHARAAAVGAPAPDGTTPDGKPVWQWSDGTVHTVPEGGQ